jgi:hypothetical protein
VRLVDRDDPRLLLGPRLTSGGLRLVVLGRHLRRVLGGRAGVIRLGGCPRVVRLRWRPREALALPRGRHVAPGVRHVLHLLARVGQVARLGGAGREGRRHLAVLRRLLVLGGSRRGGHARRHLQHSEGPKVTMSERRAGAVNRDRTGPEEWHSPQGLLLHMYVERLTGRGAIGCGALDGWGWGCTCGWGCAW